MCARIVEISNRDQFKPLVRVANGYSNDGRLDSNKQLHHECMIYASHRLIYKLYCLKKHIHR